jgi:3-phenylpropionate/trans-cinnamate dioxygenase ferredoxin subunit
MMRIAVPIDSLPLGKPVRLEIDGVGIVVIRGSAIHAFEDLCPHAKWRLSDGELVDGRLECPGHGMQFELSSGQCIDVDSHCLEPVKVSVHGDNAEFELAREPKRGAA